MSNMKREILAKKKPKLKGNSKIFRTKLKYHGFETEKKYSKI